MQQKYNQFEILYLYSNIEVHTRDLLTLDKHVLFSHLLTAAKI